MNKKISQKLNEIQRQAVEHAGGPLLIAAGAGSGKTHTLTSRLIHLLENGVKPEQIIAITFANEMRFRISNSKFQIPNSNLLFIGTFHSLGAKILKEEAAAAGRTKNFTIFDQDDALSLIKKILLELNISKDRFNPLAIMGKISEIKNEVLELDELGNSHYEKIIASVYKKYEERLQKNNAFDFDDLIEKVVRIFQEDAKTLSKYQNRWNHILVDEFQDVNTSQYLLIKLLAQKHQNLFVIGDDAQSIYAFRGSDFRNFLNFENDWQATIIKLEENYRSTKNIIRAASELIKNNKFQKPKNLWTQNPEGDLIKLFAFESGESEALGVTEKILELLRQGEPISEIAILYRTNAQSRAIEQALIQSQIAYEIFGGLKFYERKEIKDVVAALRYALNPKDTVSLERLQKNLPKSINESLLESLPELAKELSAVNLINFFIENTRYWEYLEKHFKNPEERRENILELINFASQFSSLSEFIERIALVSSLDGRPQPRREVGVPTSLSKKENSASGEKAVKLMTVHLAKGLEFNNVFIVGANDGLLPHERSLFSAGGGKGNDLEEERRLMYVAMTRAKKNLFISFYDLPSRFLGELPPELIEFKKISSYGARDTDWDDETIYIE